MTKYVHNTRRASGQYRHTLQCRVSTASTQLQYSFSTTPIQYGFSTASVQFQHSFSTASARSQLSFSIGSTKRQHSVSSIHRAPGQQHLKHQHSTNQHQHRVRTAVRQPQDCMHPVSTSVNNRRPTRQHSITSASLHESGDNAMIRLYSRLSISSSFRASMNGETA